MNIDAENTSKKRGLLMQAGILAMAGIISRIIGLLYRSPLAAIIGDEGNGYYTAAYAMYSIVLLISSYSIPSAMSKIISSRLALGEFKNAHKIFKCALVYVSIVGFVGSLILFLGADILAAGRSAVVLRFFAPTIFIFGFLGVLRGYFQAHKTMIPTSISQVVEQVFNALVSVGGALFLTRLAGEADTSKRAMYGAIGSALGTGSGVLVALLLMMHVYYTNRKEIRKRLDSDKGKEISSKEIYKMIILIVTPFILSTFIYNLSTSLNATLFSRILMDVKKMDEAAVAAMYGVFNGKSLVITNLPIAFASAASAAMIPEISGLYAKGDKEAASITISKVNKIILLIAIPSAAGLFALSKPVMMILFPQKASIDEASMLLKILAVTVVFYALSTVSNAVLQGIGRVNIPVVNALIALIIQTATLSILLLKTNLNNVALCIATILYSLLMCILNSRALKKSIDTSNSFKKTYVLPTISAVVMGVFAYLTYRLVSFGAYKSLRPVGISFDEFMYSDYFVNVVASVIAIFVAIIVYFVVLIRTGGATQEEIKRFPKGASIARLLKRMHILK
ncbi:putative polysaccharide biosynthesis protein [Butyrivibrio sp. XBB1001]|uniref:putative polysaccharide biosynthesis protein n=1 Tax=Butyrivibrio sp. XBB1001 TaxID=1280682 RepID=UPI000405CB39|nr:polysaccharide biosynthesis protein [Butyrivibrio sp. XBB1001]